MNFYTYIVLKCYLAKNVTGTSWCPVTSRVICDLVGKSEI